MKKEQLRSFRRWDVYFHWRKAVLSIFKNKLKNINLNFTVLMAYRTPRITWFHEFRQKLFILETWIWLLRPKERLYCKHLFLLHSCLSIHPKCGCQENPFSSQLCMSGVPRGAALPPLRWSAHQYAHLVLPTYRDCWSFMHTRSQILRIISCILPVLCGNIKGEKQPPVRKI